MHFVQCEECGQLVDCRQLGDVLHHDEPGHDPLAVAEELAAELVTMAGWLGLAGVASPQVGDLAVPLAAALQRAG